VRYWLLRGVMAKMRDRSPPASYEVANDLRSRLQILKHIYQLRR